MDNITASEVAGFGVGAVLLCATVAATKVDAFFSSSQRRFSLLSSLFSLPFSFFIYYFLPSFISLNSCDHETLLDFVGWHVFLWHNFH